MSSGEKVERRGALLALVLDGALVVDQVLFARLHELLEHLLELRIRAPALTHGRGILQRLDREVDLAVFLDGLDLRLNDIALPKVVVDVLDVVPVDLGDVDEAEPTVLELEERSVRRDAFDGTVDDRPYFDLSDARTPFVAGPPASPGSRRSVCGNRSRTSMPWKRAV
jgi:hypothetical protein